MADSSPHFSTSILSPLSHFLIASGFSMWGDGGGVDQLPGNLRRISVEAGLEIKPRASLSSPTPPTFIAVDCICIAADSADLHHRRICIAASASHNTAEGEPEKPPLASISSVSRSWKKPVVDLGTSMGRVGAPLMPPSAITEKNTIFGIGSTQSKGLMI